MKTKEQPHDDITDDLLHSLCMALPFVEDAEHDETYKPERVRAVIKTIKQSIEKAARHQHEHA
jgi:hypothetical protein